MQERLRLHFCAFNPSNLKQYSHGLIYCDEIIYPELVKEIGQRMNPPCENPVIQAKA